MAQFTNQATISYNGIVANSNVVTGEITQVLNIRKDATVDEYRPGDIVTYVVSIQNSGTTDFNDLTLTIDLGAYPFGTGSAVPLTHTGEPVLCYINGALQTAPAVTAGPPLVIGGLSVPAGQSSILIYRARVNGYAPLHAGAVIRNTAVLSGGGITEAISAAETVAINPDAELTIIKALTPATVVENGLLTYTFTIQNTGLTAADATAGLVVTDTFSPALNLPIAVTRNGAVWPQSENYAYDAVTGAFATVAGRVTVPEAEFRQDSLTGLWSVTPGVTTLTVSGTI